MTADAGDGRAYGRVAGGHSDPELTEVGGRHAGGRAAAAVLAPGRAAAATRPTCRARCGCSARTSILYRDGSGTAGLLTPRCCHRGTSLLYGRVEEHGIRCCYHGWLFERRRHVHSTSRASPTGGATASSYRQPWYPVVEYHGLIFTYMGPPDRQPVFPRYDIFEDLGRRRGDRRSSTTSRSAARPSRRATGSRRTRTRWTRTTCSSSTTRSAVRSSTPTSRSGRHRLAGARLGRHRHPGPRAARRHDAAPRDRGAGADDPRDPDARR